MLQESTSKILQLINNQNNFINLLQNKNTQLTQTTQQLLNQLQELKTQLHLQQQNKTNSNSYIQQQQLSPPKYNNNNNINTSIHSLPQSTPQQFELSNIIPISYSIIYQICGPNASFKYKLQLDTELQLPLYKERNFKFNVHLVDLNNNQINNENRIEIGISIYTSENPPKLIETSTTGNKILKGFAEKGLINGVANFQKIQIKEVTSHFINGWIYIVIYPKISTYSNILLNSNSTYIDPTLIEPLVLVNVVVKAKKLKDQTGKKTEQQSPEDKEDVFL